MNAEHVQKIRSILDATYPGWEGASDARFVAEEIDYKRAAIERASARLSRSALDGLIDGADSVR